MTTTANDRGYIRPEIQHLAVPTTTVHTYPGNARRGDTQKIRDSLLSHGQYKPLLAQRSTNRILIGNNTLQVMRQQGYDHVAVQFMDVDDDTARKILLMDNASSDTADYDTTGLADLLAEMPTLEGSGYSLLDLDRLLADMDGNASLDSLPRVEDTLPVSPAGPPLPDRPTADPPTTPPTPPSAPTPIPHPPPVPIVLPPVLPPTPRPTPPPDADVPWNLTLPRTDRDEAHRLIAHARDWLNEPGITTTDILLRALRTLAAVGDARHNPTTTLSMTALLMAAGRDPLANL